MSKSNLHNSDEISNKVRSKFRPVKVKICNHIIIKNSKLITIQHGANPGYSLFTQNEFKKHYGRDDNAVIVHSVDTEPDPTSAHHTEIVLGDWRGNNKGQPIIEKLQSATSKYEFKQFKDCSLWANYVYWNLF